MVERFEGARRELEGWLSSLGGNRAAVSVELGLRRKANPTGGRGAVPREEFKELVTRGGVSGTAKALGLPPNQVRARAVRLGVPVGE